MISTMRAVSTLALIVCSAGLAMAHNFSSNAATTATNSPVLLIAGGAVLTALGLGVGFALGKSKK